MRRIWNPEAIFWWILPTSAMYFGADRLPDLIGVSLLVGMFVAWAPVAMLFALTRVVRWRRNAKKTICE